MLIKQHCNVNEEHLKYNMAHCEFDTEYFSVTLRYFIGLW